MNPHIVLSDEVAKALQTGAPVVALESTIITHFMPFPKNLELARSIEATVRSNNAVPATIAILDGQLMVGLTEAQLARLAQESPNAVKASRRDLVALMVKKKIGGTTVATTMQLASLAGIRIFATGGIGGVHRGAEDTFDISADLQELASTPVAVVCAGAKSILDIPKTLEVLETNGVPVIGFGTDDFPAFFARSSGYPVDHRLDTPAEIASVIRLQGELGMRGGVLIANPVPEEAALDADEIERHIAEAVRQADREGVSRKALTPYLLNRIYALSEGKSLGANIALVLNNARLASQIAIALCASNSKAPQA